MPFKIYQHKKLLVTLIASAVISGCASLNPQTQSQTDILQHQSATIHTLDKATPIENDPIYQLLIAELAINYGQS